MFEQNELIHSSLHSCLRAPYSITLEASTVQVIPGSEKERTIETICVGSDELLDNVEIIYRFYI